MRKYRFKIIGDIFALIIVICALIGATYAYWANLSKQQLGTVIIGEGTELLLTVTADTEEGKVLVPAGNALSDNEVENVTLVYNVRLSKATSVDLNLSVTANDVKIGGIADNAGLVNIAITNPPVINNTDAEVKAVVTLTEPENAEIYTAIINKEITFTLIFSAAVPS